MKIAFLQQLSKEKQQKVLLVVIVGLIAVVAVVQFYVLRNWSDWRGAKTQIAKLIEQIGEAEAKQQRASQNEGLRQEMADFVKAQQATFVTGDPFAWVVREMSLFAEQQPVRVGGLRPGTKGELPKKSAYQTYTTRLEATGSFDQIAAYIRDIENRYPTATIRAVTFVGDSSGRQEHTAMFDLVLLMKVEPSAPPAGGKNS